MVLRRLTQLLPKIDQVHLAVVPTAAGEIVFSTQDAEGRNLPIVALDNVALEQLRQFAKAEAIATGSAISIISFTLRTLHETVLPVTTGDYTNGSSNDG